MSLNQLEQDNSLDAMAWLMHTAPYERWRKGEATTLWYRATLRPVHRDHDNAAASISRQLRGGQYQSFARFSYKDAREYARVCTTSVHLASIHGPRMASKAVLLSIPAKFSGVSSARFFCLTVHIESLCVGRSLALAVVSPNCFKTRLTMRKTSR
jgi:hypothetical protein